jgi:glycosyltransferase involved in cell wall biosynthesis
VDTQAFRPARDPEEQMEARRALGLPLGGRLLLCVGKAVPQKGWSEILEAFAKIEDELPAWTVIGVLLPMQTGPNDFRAEIERRATGHRFVSRGPVPPDLMPVLYRAVDAFVSPSHNEGLSNALVEAMASGLPVVATRVGGHAEIVEPGVSGLLVPPLDHHALAGALLELLRDVAPAAEMGRAARTAAEHLGDQRAAAAHLLVHFESVLARGRASQP